MDVRIRQAIAAHAGLPPRSGDLPIDCNLYASGMKSFASVQLMLALEDAFDIEFPETMLTPATFRSPRTIERAVGELLATRRPAARPRFHSSRANAGSGESPRHFV